MICTLKDNIRIHKVKIVALLEPRISGMRANSVIKKGFSGGIFILWNEDYEVEVLQKDWQFIALRVRGKERDRVMSSFVFTTVYASPT